MKQIKKLPLWLFLLFSCLLGSCDYKDAYVLDIHTFKFPKSIDFGKTEGLLLNVRQNGYFANLQIDKSNLSLKLKQPVYVRVNDSTLNSVDINTIDKIEIAYDSAKKSIAINQSEILKLLDDVDNSYILLKHIVRKNENETKSSKENLQKIYAITEKLQSLVSNIKKKNPLRSRNRRLIILDKNITVFTKKGTIKFSDTFPEIGVIGKSVKINFFNVTNSALYRKESELFQIQDTVYTCKVKPAFTPFGANEIFVKAEKNYLNISFDKDYRAVIPKSSVETALKNNQNVPIDIMQRHAANAYKSEVYVTDIYNIYDVPTNLATVNDSLSFKPTSYIIGKEAYSFKSISFWTYPCLIFWLTLSFLFVRLLTPIWTKEIYEQEQHGSNVGEEWGRYFKILLFILYVLGAIRIFIAYQLAYVEPYFSFTLPSAMVVAPLVLLTVMQGWVAIGMYYSETESRAINRVFVMVVFLCLFNVAHYWAYSDYYDRFSVEWETRSIKDISSCYLTQMALCTLSIGLNLFYVFRLRKYAKWLKIVMASIALVILFVAPKSSYSIAIPIITILLIKAIHGNILNWAMGYEIDRKTLFKKWFWVSFIILAPFVIPLFIEKDSGYIINIIFIPVFFILLLTYPYKFYRGDTARILQDEEATKKTRLIGGVGIFLALGIILATQMLFVKLYNPIKDTGRSETRFAVFFDFGNVHEAGIRKTEEISQFFAVLTKYASPTDHDTYEPIHPIIASFVDPVVKNDLSFPFGFIYSFSIWGGVIMLLIWTILLYQVIRMIILPEKSTKTGNYVTFYGFIRLYCAGVIVSSGLWLLMSYYNLLPFTGRLMFGLGQDSIGEVIETVILFIFMGYVAPSSKQTI